jgi:hypothetical protein
VLNLFRMPDVVLVAEHDNVCARRTNRLFKIQRDTQLRVVAQNRDPNRSRVTADVCHDIQSLVARRIIADHYLIDGM